MSKPPEATGQNLRNFFRLEGPIGIASRLIKFETDLDPYSAHLHVPPILALLIQSREAQIDNGNLLKQIRSRNGQLGRYFDRLNDRIDLLQQALLYADRSFPALSWQWTAYSEAGFEFLVPNDPKVLPSPFAIPPVDLASGSQLHLLLGIPLADFDCGNIEPIFSKQHPLYRDNVYPAGYISILGTVTSTTLEPQGRRIGISYAAITDFDRQFLARHILAVQSFRRRQSLDSL